MGEGEEDVYHRPTLISSYLIPTDLLLSLSLDTSCLTAKYLILTDPTSFHFSGKKLRGKKLVENWLVGLELFL